MNCRGGSQQTMKRGTESDVQGDGSGAIEPVSGLGLKLICTS